MTATTPAPRDADLASRVRAPLTEPAVRERAAAIEHDIARRVPGRLGVAFSGGVDSTLLLALAVRALGDDAVLAIIGVSASLAEDELADAEELARRLGVSSVRLATYEMDRPEYRRNAPDRCFHCKDELFTRIDDASTHGWGLAAVAYGETGDDARATDRPGAAAARRHGVLRPLADAGLSKLEVRELACALGLPNWDKPAMPCLASRVPHFSEVVPEKLRRIGVAEHGLRALGIDDLRVRHEDDVARIEVGIDVLPHLVRDPLRTQVCDVVEQAGFRAVALDLRGLRTGGASRLLGITPVP